MNRPGDFICVRPRNRVAWWLGVGALALELAATVSTAKAQSLQDNFANRHTITSSQGQINGNNTTASLEPGEPRHGGKTGGRSLWISWIAPTNGIVQFETQGSGFDTLLSAYYFTDTNATALSQLREIARADDSEGFERESEVEFGVLAGQRYEIAVDGYFGASGLIELEWDFLPTSFAPPIILKMPEDRAAQLGDPVVLSVNVTNVGNAEFAWYFNGQELHVTSTNLQIPSMQLTNVGRYKVRVDVGVEHFYSIPVELQVNTDGVTNALARGKLLDAPDTALIGAAGFGGSSSSSLARGVIAEGSSTISGVLRGYNGSQIFDTTYATIDTNEPPHCSVTGGYSYWLIYQPPTNGTLTLDTVGSTYDTVMEAYTYNGNLTGYGDLISIACNDNWPAVTNGAARVQFPVMKSRQYVVAVAGVNGAKGRAWLNYALNTNQLPTAPALLSQPQTLLVAEGSPAILAANLSGCPPLRYSWKKNATPIPGVTSAELVFTNTTLPDTANYVMTVTNDLGALTTTLPLQVIVAPVASLVRQPDWLKLSFPTVNGLRYTVEESVAVIGPWQPWSNFYFGDGQPITLYLSDAGIKFFRVRVQ